jgi:ribosomal protein S18 acetylase RimI-like enzyme
MNVARFSDMTLRVSELADEYAAVAAWTGQTEEQVRTGADFHGGAHLIAWQGDRIVGLAHRWRDRHGRQRLMFRRCDPGAHGPLARAMRGECTAIVETGDRPAVAALAAEGFAETGRSQEYEVPVPPTAPTAEHAGIRIRTADRVALDAMARLEGDLRGGVVDLDWFRREMVDSPYFDPLTYRVALDGDRAVGMARVWLGPRPRPHLGAIGVLPGYRRRGVGRTLLAAALAPLAERGVPVVTAVAESADPASAALFAAAGGEVTGGWIEMRRPA